MFIYYYRYYFPKIGLISPIELLAVVLGLLVALLLTAPSRETNTTATTAQNYLFSAWTGQLR